VGPIACGSCSHSSAEGGGGGCPQLHHLSASSSVPLACHPSSPQHLQDDHIIHNYTLEEFLLRSRWVQSGVAEEPARVWNTESFIQADTSPSSSWVA
ncbi:hypothetical protein CIB84_017161, partial [Bambusicola thoracicus]